MDDTLNFPKYLTFNDLTLTIHIPFAIEISITYGDPVFQIAQSFSPIFFLHLLLICLAKSVLLSGGSLHSGQSMNLGARKRWI